jgi:hypothetical protein
VRCDLAQRSAVRAMGSSTCSGHESSIVRTPLGVLLANLESVLDRRNRLISKEKIVPGRGLRLRRAKLAESVCYTGGCLELPTNVTHLSVCWADTRW